jgi:OFA family oxalate/formate antiporter-like MFS transporter
LKRPAFYVIWLMFFSGATAGLMVIGILAPFVREQVLEGGVDVVQAGAIGATAVGVLAIFNAAGRVVWGVLSDKIGRTLSFILMFVAQAAVLFVLGSLNGAAGLFAAAGLVGFNFGGNFALFPSVTADMFGSKNLGANYGWVFTSYGIAGIVGVAAGNVAKEQTGDYRYAFWMAAGLCLVSAGLALVLRPMAEREAARVAG